MTGSRETRTRGTVAAPAVPPRTAVLTVAHGRHAHLAAQQESLALARTVESSSTAEPADPAPAGRTSQTTQPAQPAQPAQPGEAGPLRVVVAMGDPEIAAVLGPLADPGTHVVPLDADPARLPLAAARNRAAEVALAEGADVLVFLDVDCLVAPGTVPALARAAREDPGTVWSGPATYLRAEDRPYPLADLARLDDPHPARPAPEPGQRVTESRWELFWSLAFAVHRDAWAALGGFDEAYAGYGAEDTDLGQRAERAGLRLGWDGGGRVYHQHHPVSRPPVEHVDDIVRNGALFAARWGWWPMTGWLAELADLGLVRRTPDGWVRTDLPAPPVAASAAPAPTTQETQP